MRKPVDDVVIEKQRSLLMNEAIFFFVIKSSRPVLQTVCAAQCFANNVKADVNLTLFTVGKGFFFFF